MRVLYLVAFLMAIKVSAQDQKFNADKFNGTIENQIVLLDLNEPYTYINNGLGIFSGFASQEFYFSVIGRSYN